MSEPCCKNPDLGGCEVLRLIATELADGVHQKDHGIIDQTWSRPMMIPPIIPWWECPLEPCAGAALRIRLGDESCRIQCGITRYLGNPSPEEGVTGVDPQGEAGGR